MTAEQRYAVTFKIEGVVAALSDIPDATPEFIEKALRNGFFELLEEQFEVDEPWVINHHFDVTVTARLES